MEFFVFLVGQGLLFALHTRSSKVYDTFYSLGVFEPLIIDHVCKVVGPQGSLSLGGDQWRPLGRVLELVLANTHN
jgi:hypothetical protein